LSSVVALWRKGDLEIIDSRPEGGYWNEIFNESSPTFFVAGYGVNRRTSDEYRSDPSLERGRRLRRYQRLSSLFDETVSLAPLAAWLPAVERERRVEVQDHLNQLLPGGTKFLGEFEGEDSVFTRQGVAVPSRALSDGYRAHIGWLSDLLFHLVAVAPDYLPLKEVGGVVLVDEVDLLLHPSWQRVVITELSKLFPKVQFLFTTHSPIVVGTLSSDNIYVTRDIGSGISVAGRINAEVHGLSADQVLVSSYFELDSTRAPEVSDELDRLALRAATGDEDARRRYLAILAKGSTRQTPS